jgi:hypothetical protein
MANAVVLFKEPRALAGLAAKPPALFLAHEKARDRFFDFFTASIRILRDKIDSPCMREGTALCMSGIIKLRSGAKTH